MEIYLQARTAERESDWVLAEKLWRSINYKTDADACKLIIDSTKEGNEYRRRVGPEPDKTENAHAWVKWYDGMTVIYKEMFGDGNAMSTD